MAPDSDVGRGKNILGRVPVVASHLKEKQAIVARRTKQNLDGKCWPLRRYS
jgi:hypothetical protein